MVSCPFNSREGGKCFVTARGRTRMTMLVLSRQPSLGWRAWRYYSSLIMIVDGIGVWLGPSAAPLFLGSSIPSDGRRNMRRFVYFRTDAHTWLGVTRYFTYIYIYVCVCVCVSLFFFFLFFTLGALFCIDGLLAAWHTLWPCVRLWLVGKPHFRWKYFQFSRIFQGKGPFDIYLSFLLSLPLATFLLSFCVWFLQLPTLRISPFVFSVSS